MISMTPHDYPLYPSQTAVLSALWILVIREGHRFWKVQTIPEEETKLITGLNKLHSQHYVFLSKVEKHYRRKNGLPVAHVVLSPRPKGGVWQLALVANRPLKGEAMTDIRKTPLVWPAWRETKGAWEPFYVLKQDPRGVWTWHLTETAHRELLEEALALAHAGEWTGLVLLLKRIGELPPYRGIRTQAKEILKRVQGAWGDRHIRHPDGQWKRPPWKQVVAEWGRTLPPLGVHLRPKEPPRTLGEWLEMGPD
jgi:hypothetical protein